MFSFSGASTSAASGNFNVMEIYKQQNSKINTDYNSLFNLLKGNAPAGFTFIKQDTDTNNRYMISAAINSIIKQDTNKEDAKAKLTILNQPLKDAISNLNTELKGLAGTSSNTAEVSMEKIAKIMSISYYSKLLVIIFIYVQQMLITFQCNASQVQQQETAQLAAQKNAERERAVAAKEGELKTMQETMQAQIKSLQEQAARNVSSKNGAISSLQQEIEALKVSQNASSEQTKELLAAERKKATDFQAELIAEKAKTATKEAENAQLRELLKEAIPIMASFSLDGL